MAKNRFFKDKGPCYIGFGKYKHVFRTLERREEFEIVYETEHGEYGGELTIFKCAVCGLVEEDIMSPEWRLKNGGDKDV